MKILYLALPPLLIALSSFESFSASPPTKSNLERTSATINVESVVAKLEMTSPSTTKKCPLKLELVDPEPDDTRLYESGGLLRCKIRLIDAKGTPCPYSKLGASTIGAEVWIGYDSQIIFLKKAQPEAFLIKLDELFSLKPGIWNLEIDVLLHKGKMQTQAARSLPLSFKGIRFSIPE